MDEKSLNLNKGNSLPDTERVYRIVLVTQRDRKNKQVPSTSCFSLSNQDENLLSVDWEKKTTPEQSVARFGASYKFGKEEYKSYVNREIYRLDVSFLRSLPQVDDVFHDPIFHDVPLKGRVDNPAHSLVEFNKKNDPELLLKIRDHAAENRIEVNFDEVHELVDELKRQQS